MPNAISEPGAGNNCRVKVDPRTPVIVGVGQIARFPVGDHTIGNAADSVT